MRDVNRILIHMTICTVIVVAIIGFIVVPAINGAAKMHEKIVRVHDCPSAMLYGDELDVDYWC